MKNPRRAVCVCCKKDRIVAADLGVQACVTSAPAWLQHLFVMKGALCRGCTRRLMGKNSVPVVNLAFAGIVKHLTPKQEEAQVLARKRTEKKALQRELEWGMGKAGDMDHGDW